MSRVGWLRALAALVAVGMVAWWPRAQSPRAHAAGGTRIVINILQRRLYLYRDGRLFQAYPVAVGQPDTPSPRGEFVITQKAVWGDGFGTRWMRISVPWGIYGIHGTNKPWSVGTVASHGCFRMLNRDVEQLYALVAIGTTVDVVGATPMVKIRRPLKLGVIGQDVVELQRLLRLAAVYPGRLEGTFTPAVETAVKKFQLVAHLPETGVADLPTVARLREFTGQVGPPGYLYQPPAAAPRAGSGA